jgi:hypothetical protein
MCSEVTLEQRHKFARSLHVHDSNYNACLLFSCRFNCDEGVLENELQQLGLPKEHTVALSRTFKDKKDAMRTSMAER